MTPNSKVPANLSYCVGENVLVRDDAGDLCEVRVIACTESRLYVKLYYVTADTMIARWYPVDEFEIVEVLTNNAAILLEKANAPTTPSDR
jgi:hypothetical protein